jgi:hypothetical protein
MNFREIFQREITKRKKAKLLQLLAKPEVVGGSYIVIYDVKVGEGELREEWYGYFSSEKEAVSMFADAFDSDENVGNARLGVALHPVPSRTIEV